MSRERLGMVSLHWFWVSKILRENASGISKFLSSAAQPCGSPQNHKWPRGTGKGWELFPRGPQGGQQTQQINNPHFPCVQDSVRSLRMVALLHKSLSLSPSLQKNSGATPLKKSPKTGDQRLPACDLCHPLSLCSPHRGEVSCFQSFFSIKYNKKSTTTMNNVGSVACACPEGA